MTVRTTAVDPIRRRLAAITGGTVVVLLLAACSLPVDERVTPLDQSAFPDDLTEPTTTTTTTTTTTAPETTVPADTNPGVETTTTVPIVPTEAVTVFYTRGVSDVMQPVEVVASSPALVTDLIAFLERPTGIAEFGFRSAVRPGLIDRIGPVDRGVATVALDADVLERMSESTRQQAVAQIVLTVTSFRTADVGAIGRVRFEVDGEGFPVYVPAFGGTSEPGEELAFTDFQTLIATTPTPATTTTSVAATAPTSTAEPVDEGGDGQ